MKKLFAAFVLLFASTLTFAQRSVSNFPEWPYGPPTNSIMSSIPAKTLFVNRIPLAYADQLTLGRVTFDLLVKSATTNLLLCLYADLVSGPVWQMTVPLTTKGPQSAVGSDVVFTGPQPFYFAYAETGGNSVAIESFATGQYPEVAATLNVDPNNIFWGQSPNYVDGQGCPASLGVITFPKSMYDLNWPWFRLQP